MLRKFGFNLALGISIAGFIMYLRHKPYFIWFSGTGALILVCAIAAPLLLKQLKKILDAVILSAGRLTGFLSSLLAFYLIVTPAAILLRLIGRDLLREKIDKKAASYWLPREARNRSREDYEQMG
ncbi:MAG: hypothetical protein WC569_03085 [Candidatus Omnitrophota bacterium]